MRILEQAPAKVNLSLLVGPRRADGYHELFTVFAPVDVYDDLEFDLTLGPDGERPGRIELECLGLEGEDNLVARALRGMESLSGRSISGRVRVRKLIPVGAGMGGGSSDAAAAIRAAVRLLDQEAGIKVADDRLRGLARSLGADVPFFLGRGPAVARGIGDELRPIDLPPLSLVAVLPEARLSTRDVYRTFDDVGDRETPEEFAHRAEQAESRWLEAPASSSGETGAEETIQRIAPLLANDLERASFYLLPELARIKDDILEAGAVGALMTGSGPTMFGLCSLTVNRAETVADRLAAKGYRARDMSTI